MKAKDLIEFLKMFDGNDEVEIEIYDTETGRYVDTTAAIAISDIMVALGPVLKIDVEADKFRCFPTEADAACGLLGKNDNT